MASSSPSRRPRPAQRSEPKGSKVRAKNPREHHSAGRNNCCDRPFSIHSRVVDDRADRRSIVKKFMALLGGFVLCFLFSGCRGDKGKSTPADPTGPGGGDTFPTMSAALDGSNIHVVLENMADDAG